MSDNEDLIRIRAWYTSLRRWYDTAVDWRAAAYEWSNRFAYPKGPPQDMPPSLDLPPLVAEQLELDAQPYAPGGHLVDGPFHPRINQ